MTTMRDTQFIDPKHLSSSSSFPSPSAPQSTENTLDDYYLALGDILDAIVMNPLSAPKLISHESYISLKPTLKDLASTKNYPHRDPACDQDLEFLLFKISKDEQLPEWTTSTAAEFRPTPEMRVPPVVSWTKNEQVARILKKVNEAKDRRLSLLSSSSDATTKTNLSWLSRTKNNIQNGFKNLYNDIKNFSFAEFKKNHAKALSWLWLLMKWVVIPTAIAAALVFSGGFAAIPTLVALVGVATKWGAFAILAGTLSVLSATLDTMHTMYQGNKVVAARTQKMAGLPTKDSDLRGVKLVQQPQHGQSHTASAHPNSHLEEKGIGKEQEHRSSSSSHPSTIKGQEQEHYTGDVNTSSSSMDPILARRLAEQREKVQQDEIRRRSITGGSNTSLSTSNIQAGLEANKGNIVSLPSSPAPSPQPQVTEASNPLSEQSQVIDLSASSSINPAAGEEREEQEETADETTSAENSFSP